MAILEELVSKIGFEVEGLAELKAASKQFAAVKKDVTAVANPLRVAGTTSTVAAVGIGKLGDASRKSSRSVLLLSTALAGLKRAGSVALSVLRTIIVIALRGVAAFAALTAAVLGIGLAVTRMGAKIALARREFALMAKEAGTTAQNLETTTNIFKYLGFGDKAKEEAGKAVTALSEVLKTIRKGGDEADEAKKKFAGLGIDASFQIDKNGNMRDAAAVLLDVVLAYKKLNEEAAGFRKQADAIEAKQPFKGQKSPSGKALKPDAKARARADALRAKALEKDRKALEVADNAGIDGRLKVLIDEKSTKQLKELADRAGSERPTTSNASEERMARVAEQAERFGLTLGAIGDGLKERLSEFAVWIADYLIGPLNTFAEALLSLAKRIGLISETKGEQKARTEAEREASRAEAMRTPPEKQAEEFAKKVEENRLKQFERQKAKREKGRVDAQSLIDQTSPATNAAKMEKKAEVSNDLRKYENIGNDQRTISPSITVNATGLEAVAEKLKQAVLGTISTKGANTSTGALTAP